MHENNLIKHYYELVEKAIKFSKENNCKAYVGKIQDGEEWLIASEHDEDAMDMMDTPIYVFNEDGLLNTLLKIKKVNRRIV